MLRRKKKQGTQRIISLGQRSVSRKKHLKSQPHPDEKSNAASYVCKFSVTLLSWNFVEDTDLDHVQHLPQFIR